MLEVIITIVPREILQISSNSVDKCIMFTVCKGYGLLNCSSSEILVALINYIGKGINDR